MISTQNFRVEHGLQIGDVVIDAASGIVSATSFFGDGSGLTGISGGGGGESYWVSTLSGIHTTSNVGIGTTNPQTKLEINGVLGFGTFDNAGTRTNIRIGDNATGANITDGYDNIFMGIGAGNSTTTGCNNNFLGESAGRSNTTGCNNNFFGLLAGGGAGGIISTIGITSFTTLAGEANNFYDTGEFIFSIGISGTGGDGNGAIFSVQRDETGAVSEVNIIRGGLNYTVGNTLTIDGASVGGSSGTDDITITVNGVEETTNTGCNNNFFGCSAGRFNTTGCLNNFLGKYAGGSNTEGSYNNFFGGAAGAFNVTGCLNNFFGMSAGLFNTTGCLNNFFGAGAGAFNQTGCTNNIFGTCAGSFACGGEGNNFFGFLAGAGINLGAPGLPTPRNAGCANNFFGAFSGIANNGALGNNFFGNLSGIANTTGSYNNFFGTCAGQTITNGSYNIAIGHSVQLPNPSGNTQLAIGSGSTSWINGNENFNVGMGTTDPTSKLTVVGDVLVSGVVTATAFVGDGSGLTGISGGGGGESYWVSTLSGIHTTSSVGIGTTNPQTKLEINGVLGFGTFDNSGTSTNIRIGDNTTGASITSGYDNIFMGIGAGNSTTTGCNNNFLGNLAGRNNTTGYDNNFLGFQVGFNNTTGRHNNFLGNCAGYSNTTGRHNNFFGKTAGRNNTTGQCNNFFGLNAGQGRIGRIASVGITTFTTLVGEANNTYSNVSGTGGDGFNATFFVERDVNGDVDVVNITIEGYDYNVGNILTIDGTDVGGSSGTDDVTITINTVEGSTGNNNNFLGSSAGRENTTGCNNNFFGRDAGYNNTTGCYNNFFGNNAGFANTTGNYNNFFGRDAGFCNTTGCYNNFFGRNAGEYNTTGNNNTFLGNYSGISTSASNKIIFGSGYDYLNYFDSPDPTKDTQFAVGIRTDANPANYWLVGDENFNVGIGTTSPQYKLDVGGDAKISDIRISGTQIIGDGTYSTLGDLKLIPNDTLIGTGQYVKLRPTTNLDQTHIHIEAGNVNNADLYLGDDDRFVKIDHTGPVVIGVPSTATTSNWTAPSDGGPTTYLGIDIDVYPWAQYLTLGDTITLPDTTVVNIINNYLSGNIVGVYLDSNISYLTDDILVFGYTPRTEWKFNSDSSAVFPGIVTATSFVGNGSGLTNLPTPSRTTVTGITTIISSGGIGNTDISGFKTYLLLKVGISTEAWIRIYTDSDSRSNDASRPINIDPTSGSGIVAEFVSVGATTIKTGPSLIGYNDDDPEENIIYMSVNNLSGISTSIEVNLTILKMEE